MEVLFRDGDSTRPRQSRRMDPTSLSTVQFYRGDRGAAFTSSMPIDRMRRQIHCHIRHRDRGAVSHGKASITSWPVQAADGELGNVEVKNEVSLVDQNDTGIENPERRRGHSESMEAISPI